MIYVSMSITTVCQYAVLYIVLYCRVRPGLYGLQYSTDYAPYRHDLAGQSMSQDDECKACKCFMQR